MGSLGHRWATLAGTSVVAKRRKIWENRANRTGHSGISVKLLRGEKYRLLFILY